VVTQRSEKYASAQYDRVFYSGMAALMALTVLCGFGPTYYLHAFDSASGVTISGAPITLLVHAHGAAFTGWVVLFVVQTALVARHRVAIHRRIGIAGALLATCMVVLGAVTAVKAAARGAAPAGIDPLSFLMIPLSDVVLFGTFVATALWRRRDREAHKRLMLLAYVSIIVAAVARLPGVLPLGPLAFFGLAFLFIAAGIAYDAVSRRRVHPVYVWGGGLFLLSVPVRLVVSQTDAWKGIAQSLVRLMA
jgi:FtsH-binding integral membrane protein